MKLKLLLLFLFVVSSGIVLHAQTKKPYNNLIITEAKLNRPEFNYAEITNQGTETINLKNFYFGKIDPWTAPWASNNASNGSMLPDKELAPGQSFVIATRTDYEQYMWTINPTKYRERVTKPELYKLADLFVDLGESGPAALDVVTSWNNVLGSWGGRDCLFLRHHYMLEDGITKDSMVIDQVNGMFTGENGNRIDGNAVDVAGTINATGNSVLIRKNSVKTGIQEFSSNVANIDAAKLQFGNNKGLDLGDSEWIPVPILGNESDYELEPWRAVFWTVGNSVDAKLDATALVSKTGKAKVDLTAGTITVPWGIRNKDSIMYQFNRKPGLAWKYDLAGTTADSAFISARTGDKLTVYACGDVPAIKEFSITVLPATADDNIVIPKNSFNYTRMIFGKILRVYSGYRVTDGVKAMDTISNVDFATRVDTLFKYLEKAPNASWKIKFKDGIDKPEIKNGDILSVTSGSGKVKDYFLKLEKFFPSNDAYLSSITWPDMPSYFRGAVAESYGWAGDTIPGFIQSKFDYIVKIPLEYNGIPALVFTKQQLDSRVVVARAKTLEGTPEERTVTYTVTAESDTIVNVYTVRFEKEKDNADIQPNKAEPFISQFVWNDEWTRDWIEIVNPGTEPLDLSHYMIIRGNDANVLTWWNGTGDFGNAWKKYVPGKKWQDDANWQVQPRILETDLAVNAIVYPGDVFVMAANSGNGSWNYYKNEADVNFATNRNPWGLTFGSNPVSSWYGLVYLYKIENDSVINGLKPATDVNDFTLIDCWGQGDWNAWKVGGVNQGQLVGYTRKPNIYKGNPVLKASFGTTWDDCEWIARDRAYFDKLGIGWPLDIYKICDGLGSHIMNDITIYRSTVSSKMYKVSSGYSMNETIKGLTTGTTVTGFYGNILKANELQTLKVKSAANGAELAEAALLSKGDTLVVLSADSTNISKYILDVTVGGLSSNAVLTSAKYTVAVTGSTGTISGIKQREKLKTVYDAVIVPAGASLTITDANDAYMSLLKLNYDTAYSDVIATDKIYFEVVAENGTTKILYQLKPTTNLSDAYVTSDVYSVDQFASLIQFVPGGTSVNSLIANVVPAAGAKIVVFDKAGFERTTGDVYRDDKLVVTSADGKTTKAYYFSMLNLSKSGINNYFAFVISDDYWVDQVNYEITGPATPSISAFRDKLYPSFGATLSVIGKDGKVNSTGTFNKGDKLLVTAADGLTTATYNISVITKAIDVNAETIKMYPNPTDGRVIVQGLAKGNRVRVINAAGITLRDVIVDNSTDYVSLAAQPAGIYVFVISNGDQFINIQKIVKK